MSKWQTLFDTTLSPEQYEEAVEHLTAINYFQVASWVTLIYDHALTFDEEVERIWKRRVTGATILFILNRYITPLQFLISIVAHNDPTWSRAVCERFAPFQGATAVAMLGVCELIMILRVSALYGRNMVILAGLMTLWTAQVILSAIGISAGRAIKLPPGVAGCILSGQRHHSMFPTLWVTPLVTDAVIFFLTLYRARIFARYSLTIRTLRVFVRDGALYFLAICLGNFINLLVYFLSPVDDLRSLGASFSQIITSIIISRMVLNLRSEVTESRKIVGQFPANTATKNNMDKLVERAIGDLDTGHDTIVSADVEAGGIVVTRTEYVHADPTWPSVGKEHRDGSEDFEMLNRVEDYKIQTARQGYK